MPNIKIFERKVIFTIVKVILVFMKKKNDYELFCLVLKVTLELENYKNVVSISMKLFKKDKNIILKCKK